MWSWIWVLNECIIGIPHPRHIFLKPPWMSSKLLSYFWNSAEKFGSQIVRFALGIILARILSPRDYGLIGLLIVFTAVAQIFVDSGFSKALIQRNDKNPTEVNTTFTFNLIISLFLYVLLFFSAPAIANFYEEGILTGLLRVLALTLIINALFAIPNTLLSIDLNFKRIAYINFTAIVVSGILAIYLAVKGFGVWALVYQYLSKSIITLVLFWSSNIWKPKLILHKPSLKNLFSFGVNITISSLLNQIVGKFSWLIIGKSFSTADLGYYNRGIQFPDTAIGTLGTVLDTVLLPNLAKTGNEEALRLEVTNVLKYLSIITIPITVSLIVLAEPLILVLLTSKWSAAIPILQIFCLSRFVTNFSSLSINALYTINKANLVLRQQYLKMAVRIVSILLTIQYGIVFLAVGELVAVVINFVIGTYYPGKLLKFGFLDQIRILWPYLLIGVLELIILYGLLLLITEPILELILIPISSVMLHAGLLYITRRKDFERLKTLILKLRKRNEK